MRRGSFRDSSLEGEAHARALLGSIAAAVEIHVLGKESHSSLGAVPRERAEEGGRG